MTNGTRNFPNPYFTRLAIPLIGILFGGFQIQHSLTQGQLSFPIAYDDIVYFVDALRRLHAFYDDGFSRLFTDYIQKPVHSPLATLTCFLGFLTFGVRDWAPAAVNIVYLIVFLYFVMDLAKGINWVSRILLLVIVLSCPLPGHLIVESRPDILCGMATACAAFTLMKVRTLNVNREQPKLYVQAGIATSIAFLAKPSISPVTCVILISAFTIPLFTDNLYQGRLRKPLFRPASKSKILSKGVWVFALIVLVSVTPHYLLHGQHIFGYIYRTIFGENRELWHFNSSLAQQLLFYITGSGGGMMFGQWYLLLTLVLVISLALTLFDKDWRSFSAAVPYGIITIIIYVLVTIPKTKSVFLGMAFGAQVLLCVIHMAIYIFEKLERKSWKWISSWLVLPVIWLPVLITSAISFEWQWHNRTGREYTISATQQAIYDRELLLSIAQVIQDDYFMPTLDSRDSLAVILTLESSYLTTPGIEYAFLKNGVREAKVVRNRAFLSNTSEYLDFLASMNYIVVPSLDNPTRLTWLPANKVQSEVLEELRGNSNFILLETFKRPQELGGGQVYLYKNISP